MRKHFKLRLSKVILPIFQSCKSKDPSKLPENPLPLLLHLPLLRRPNSNTIDHDNVNDFPGFATCTPSPLPLKPHHHRQQPSLKQQVSSAILSVGCNCRSKSSNTNEEEGDEFRWKIDTKWHVIDKINDDTTPRSKIYSQHYDSEEDEEEEEEEELCINNQASPLLTKIKKKKKRSKKNKIRSRVSTSSGDSGWFSSEEEEEDQENEAQVSSSSEFFETHLKTIRESPLNDDSSSIKRSNVKKTKKKKSTATHAAKRDQNVKRYSHNKRGLILYSSSSSTETESSPARLSAFQRLMRSSSNSTCKAEGKVKESFAVVKKSEDPYQDFRKSMMEMILEKQMFESKDLEQLLHCLLSLNSKHHHPIIIRAFSEIWEFLFCSSSSL
ncbi:hypothetical protein C5167_013939 [Papaver somniferum]|uniref:Transcription repressor n=1 Tax=Papaver somniferum TaxID=3469 RepID=A0A4Y7J3S8_PAPSO|nr:transcription repressor OFP7-like [Papaver somniferum]RZC55086.1 hypothetical protein C5167_013939 [Papaver somniferum]